MSPFVQYVLMVPEDQLLLVHPRKQQKTLKILHHNHELGKQTKS